MQIFIVGVVVSLLVQWLKQQFGPENEWKSLLVLALVCLIASAFSQILISFGYWEAFVGILMTASTFYALVLARFRS